MIRIGSLFLVMFLSTIPASAGASGEGSAGRQLAQLFDDVWQFDLREDPLWATRVGVHRYNDQLPRTSVADSERRQQAKQEFFERLEAIDRAQLSATDQTNYDIFARTLRDELADFRFRTYLMPITNRWGFHVDFPELRRRAPLVTTEDFENYIARLAQFDDYTAGHIELMRAGVRAEITQPAVILERYREPIEVHLVDNPEDSLLYEPLQDMPSTVPASEHERLRAAAREAIAQSVVPGYRRFLEFMEEEYVPNCRATTAASALPDGRDFYRSQVRKFTTLDVTPDEVHATGKAEVARIREEMEAIIRRVEFDGDFDEFVDHLRSNEKFYAKSEEELLRHVAFALKKMDGRLPTLFGRLPRMPYGVRPVPAYVAPTTMAAYYERPAGDGTKAGFFFMNTYNLPSRPLYTVEALSLHEAVPGHHLQIALQQELSDLPEFRQHSGFTVFSEGWALYAERLGLEAGFYEDPYSDFGRLTMEMWRACRLVVDTGLHYRGWTRDEAIDYLRDNSALSLHNIRSEVDRYIGWPGQALAYKTGELKIRALRTMAEEQLGERFDIRTFHDVVLGSGAVPLDVLESNVRGWVERVSSE